MYKNTYLSEKARMIEENRKYLLYHSTPEQRAKMEAEEKALEIEKVNTWWDNQKRYERESAERQKRWIADREQQREEARQEALHPHKKPGYELESAYNDFLSDMVEMGRIKSFEWLSTEQKEIPYDFKVTTNKGNTLYLDTVGNQITIYGRKRLHTSHKHLDDTLRDIKKNNRASRFYLVFDDGDEFMYLPVTEGLPTANIVLSRARYKSCRRSEFVFRT